MAARLHRGFHESDNGGPAPPAPTRKPRRCVGGAPAKSPPSYPPPAVGRFRPRPPAGPPKPLEGRLFGPGSPGQGATRRAPGFSQRNPSAAGRALVLITPHSPRFSPAYAGVTSATRTPARFRNASPKPSHSHMAGPLQPPALPSRRRSYNCGCGGRAESHASLCGGPPEVLPSSPSLPGSRLFRAPTRCRKGKCFAEDPTFGSQALAEGLGEERAEENVG